MRRNPLFWGILGLALLVGLVTTLDRYQRQGRIFAGFWVMENLLVAIGGPERGSLQPFDVVRVMNGQVVRSGRDIQATIESQDPGARFQYIVYRRGELVETEVATRLYTGRDFLRFVVESLLPATLQLAIGAVVFLIRPGRPQSWLFLVFTLVAYLVTVTYGDAHTTYRFSGLFLTAWAFWPATLVHLALTFPQRRGILRRFPRVVWLPYLASAVVALLLQLPFVQADVRSLLAVPAVAAAYWGVALLLLVLSLARASVVGGSPLIRQRARVLCAAFVLGYVPPILGTVVEALFQVRVPYLNALWRLTLLFPAVMAYAMVRYDLYDVRAAIRAGAAYSAATGVVVLGYTGAIAAMDLLLTNWEASQSPIVVAGIMAVLVVVVLNPLYLRSQRLVDRLFFRQRVDVQRSIEGVSEVMSGVLDLRRIAELLGQTVDEQLHPEQQELYLLDANNPRYVRANLDDDEGEPRPPIDAASALVRSLERVRQPMTRARVEEDPGLDASRAECLEAMDALGAILVVPFVFQGRVTGFLALGPKRSSLGYSGQDLGLLRLLANSSALALEHARAYHALEATNAELTATVRRVEILESIRTNLAKFVPQTVQDLIERAPEAPELDKREADVTVLFVDLVGYSRLTERLDPGRVNELVERCFGAYLDEILRRGGDVNETAGDGLMAIFRKDADPRRHARQAVKCALEILRRTRELNEVLEGLPEPLAVHAGVNSGVATVGATKIEGANGTRWTYTASGQVTIVAARLAGLASADEVLVGAATRERLGAEFSFVSLGERALRNVEAPVSAFRLALPEAAPVTA